MRKLTAKERRKFVGRELPFSNIYTITNQESIDTIVLLRYNSHI